tara:strand:- start:297 stop:602 length:306 start_codon:yes stop_codon:yes gene_type:complete
VKSSKPNKKWDAVFMIDGKEKIVSFGSAGMRDYTLVSNKLSKFYLPKMVDRNVVRDSYKRRHKKDLETKDPMRPGYLSYYLLWNKKTLASSIKDYKKRFKL